MISNFFDSNTYFIDEKVNFFKFENVYNIYDGEGKNVGAVKQKLTTGQKMLRLLLKKPMLPFLLEIKDEIDQVEATISRGWTFWMSKITIADADGAKIGMITQKFKFFKPTFTISDKEDRTIATITGDWKAWNFVIKDNQEKEIGKISKKWAGLAQEMFTTADKYNVNLNAEITNKEHKMAILASAITVDMVLKESK